MAVLTIGAGVSQATHKLLTLINNWRIHTILGREGSNLRIKRERVAKRASDNSLMGTLPSYNSCKNAMSSWFKENPIWNFIAYGDKNSNCGSYCDTILPRMEIILYNLVNDPKYEMNFRYNMSNCIDEINLLLDTNILNDKNNVIKKCIDFIVGFDDMPLC